MYPIGYIRKYAIHVYISTTRIKCVHFADSALGTNETISQLPLSATWPSSMAAANDASGDTSIAKTPEPPRDSATESDAADTTLTPGMVAAVEDAAATAEPETKKSEDSEKAEKMEETSPTETDQTSAETKDVERTPLRKRRASEPLDEETPTSSKLSRTGSPDKNSEMVKSMRIRDQMRHQRFHQQQQRFQSAMGDKKRRGASGADLARSPRGRRRAGGVGPRRQGSRQPSSPEKNADVYEFHSSSDSEEQRTLPMTRERKSSDRRTDQVLTEQQQQNQQQPDQQSDSLNASRSADVTPAPADAPAPSVPQVSNSAPSTPSVSTAMHHSKKGRLLGLPALITAAPATEQSAAAADVAGSSTADADDGTEGDRKVPPLRISLTKTPSEEDGQSGPIDARARSAEPAEAQTSAKVVGKNASSDGSGNGQDTKAQRVTRSKLRAQGLQLDEAEAASGLNLHPHKRKGPWRRSSAAGVLSTSVAPVDQGASPAPAPAPWSAPSSDSAASLMKKNSYEGFRLMRRLVSASFLVFF